MSKPLQNKDGSISAQGFACGYVDTSHGHGTRIEARHGVYLACADGGYAVLYNGPKLSEARKACRDYSRLARRYWFKPYGTEAQGVGAEYVARIRRHGVIIGTGATLADAMREAARYEANEGEG